MPWFFSYAEFGPEGLSKLLQKAPFCSLPAVVANHQVIFRGKSRKWGGGHSTIEPKKGNRVFGAAHLITSEELELITRYYRDAYKAKVLPIIISVTQDKFSAVTFVFAKDEEITSPSDDSSKEIIKNLKFFWGQDSGKAPTLEDFGIAAEISPKLTKVKK
ncbi:hypothetical protein C4588_02990 [Candidatus Parcubacteria bacterium]|nr:MAG: hypothetical protein C4588_02990 [Candidatus Parcubacteria bacterium]